MNTKISPGIMVKAAGPDDGLQEGEFLGYASVFDNVDSTGDVMKKGAFAATLQKFGDNGAGIPALWGHRMDDPDFNIGVTKSAVEDDHGLLVHVALDLDSPKGAYVHKLIKEKRVAQMSFAYAVTDGKALPGGDKGDYQIDAVDLYEVSVVPVGANQETELLGVKNVTINLSKDFSTDVEEAPESKGAAEDVLAKIRALLDEFDADDSSEEPEPPTDEDPNAGKSNEAAEAKARNAAAALTFIQSLKGAHA